MASRKSPEFPRRNAKTRWGEPAGLERNGHVAVTKCMEAGRIALPSRDPSTAASTGVVDNLKFRFLERLSTGFLRSYPKTFLTRGVLGVTTSDPELLTSFWATPVATLNRGCVYLRSQCEIILGN